MVGVLLLLGGSRGAPRPDLLPALSPLGPLLEGLQRARGLLELGLELGDGAVPLGELGLEALHFLGEVGDDPVLLLEGVRGLLGLLLGLGLLPLALLLALLLLPLLPELPLPLLRSLPLPLRPLCPLPRGLGLLLLLLPELLLGLLLL